MGFNGREEIPPLSNWAAGSMGVEQPGVIPSSLVYENQQSFASFPPSSALLLVAVQCGFVRLYWRFNCQNWARSRNKCAEPTYFSTPLRWITKPSERSAKTWSYTHRYSEITLEISPLVWPGHWYHKHRGGLTWSINQVPNFNCLTMTNILKHSLVTGDQVTGQPSLTPYRAHAHKHY